MSLKSLVNSAKGLLAKRPEPATKAVQHDRFDQEEFREALEDAPALQTLVDTVGERHGYAPQLLQDTFNLFWQGDPRVRSREDMHPKAARNQAVVEALRTLPETDKARAYSVGDKYGAVMAALSVGEKLIDLLDQTEEPDTDQAEEQLDKAMEQLQDAVDKAEAGDGSEEALSNAQDAAEAALAQWQQMAQEAADGAEAASQRVTAVNYEQGKYHRSDVAQSVDKAGQELAAATEAAAGAGLDPATMGRLPFDDRSRLAKVLSAKKLEEFRKLLGRFRFKAKSAQAKKVDYGRDEVYAITLSGNLPEVLGTEIAKMAHPRLHAEFMRRLATRHLLSRKWRGKQKAGDGPVVVCLDESSSMKGMKAWFAKALALVLMESSFTSKRAFYAISFSTSQKLWPLTPQDPMMAVDFIESALGGGTQYVPALRRAGELIEKNPDARVADIVFITDGKPQDYSATFAEEWKEWRQEHGVRVWGLAIDHAPSKELEAVSDTTRSIFDFTDVEQMTDLLRTV